MAIKDILLLGNPNLYEVCSPVKQDELLEMGAVVDDLHDTLMAFRKRWGAGRAVAAPQIGIMKRLVYMHIDTPTVFINPYFEHKSNKMQTVWDDCMSFPELLVQVERHASLDIVYRDMSWKEQQLSLTGDLAELLQHECDHLDGVLAVSRAVSPQAFALRSQQQFTNYDRSTLPEAS